MTECGVDVSYPGCIISSLSFSFFSDYRLKMSCIEPPVSERKMGTRKFTFRNDYTSEGTKEKVVISTPELWEGDYGLYTWPAAPVLAQYIWYNQQLIKDKHVLELGAGTGVAGILAATCGARVTLTDGRHLPECLQNTRRSCQLNQLQLPVLGLTWGEFSEELVSLDEVDHVIASDCFYKKRDFDNVMLTVCYLMEKSAGCQFWCSYQERSANKSLEYHLLKYGMTCTHVPLTSFHAAGPDLAESGLPGRHTIHMLVITKL